MKRVRKKGVMYNKPDLVGKEFGKLVVTRFAGLKYAQHSYECKCICGNTIVATTTELNKGKVVCCAHCRKREKSKHLVGEKVLSSWDGYAECVDSLGSKLKVRFIVNGNERWVTETQFNSRGFKDIARPADYNDLVKKTKMKVSIAKQEWRGIIDRATKDIVKNRQPTYMECSLDERWKEQENYIDWFMSQEFAGRVDDNGNKYHIEKDLLVFSNKIYGPDFCVHVPWDVNVFLHRNTSRFSSKFVGVAYVDSSVNKHWSATMQCKSVGLFVNSYFNTEEDAHEFYKTNKILAGKLLAEKWKNKVDDRVINVLLNIPDGFYVRI